MTKRDILLARIWDNGSVYEREYMDDEIINTYYGFNTKKDISNALYQLKKLGFIVNDKRGSYFLTAIGEEYCNNNFGNKFIEDEDSFDSDDEFADESEEQPIYNDDEDDDEDMNPMFNISISKWTAIANHYASIAQHYAEIAKLHANM